VKAAEKSLLELYADPIRKADSAAKVRQLAKLLLADAQSSRQQDATVYVMIGEAIRIATNVGDAKTAVEAIRELDSRFEVDYWELVRDAIDDAAKNSSPATAADFKHIVDDLINTAIQDQQFSEADWVVGRAIKMARRAGDNAVEEDYQQLRKRIKSLNDLAEQNIKAIAILETNPADTQANLQRGDYLFVVANRLDEAMEYWQKCEDDEMKQIVQLSSVFDRNEVKSMLDLAVGYEHAGQALQTLKDRKCLQRALALYQTARVKLEGLEQRKIDAKIASIKDSLEN
jgi:hypothetical protein